MLVVRNVDHESGLLTWADCCKAEILILAASGLRDRTRNWGSLAKARAGVLVILLSLCHCNCGAADCLRRRRRRRLRNSSPTSRPSWKERFPSCGFIGFEVRSHGLACRV